MYWPREKGQNLTTGNMVITLKNETIKQNWTERVISVALPELRESRIVLHLQFLAWPGR